MAKERQSSSQGQSNRNQKEGQDDSQKSLREAFLDELADIYSAEQQLTKALPKMAKAAESEDLKAAFESHLQETQGQISRLEEVAAGIGESIKRKKCKAMEGLVEEGEEIIEEFGGEPAGDATLIAAAQKVEHYEIATYGTLRAWAEQLNFDDAVGLLQETLDEEEAADQKLTSIAESIANTKAQQ